MTKKQAVVTLSQEHARESGHVFDDSIRRGTRCSVCVALDVVAGTIRNTRKVKAA